MGRNEKTAVSFACDLCMKSTETLTTGWYKLYSRHFSYSVQSLIFCSEACAALWPATQIQPRHLTQEDVYKISRPPVVHYESIGNTD